MIIRLADHDDIDQLIKMRWDFSGEYQDIQNEDYSQFYLNCKDFLLNALQVNTWYIWVAEVNDTIVSHIFVELIHKVPRPGKPTNPFVYMTNVYTVPGYRGNGIGGKLIREIEVWAKSNRYEFIIVWPSENSIRFYEQNGYRHCKEPMELMLE